MGKYDSFGRNDWYKKVRVVLPTCMDCMPAPRTKVMLTRGEAAQLLGWHPNTVKWWSAKGMPKVYRVGTRGDGRFPRKDIDAFLAEASGAASSSA